MANKAKAPLSSTQPERVFWSGGDKAKDAATAFAKETGRTTIGMTSEGQVLEQMGANATRDMWREASGRFAQSAIGNQTSAHVFINRAALSSKSIWLTTEKKILESAFIKIIPHYI